MSDANQKIDPPEVCMGLVHWPCWNSKGDVVATNVTNLDIHDIARASRSFGVTRYYIINRLKEQLMFVHRVLDHWRLGVGKDRNSKRGPSIDMVRTAEDLEQALSEFDVRPLVVATSAQSREDVPTISYNELREKIWHDRSRPTFLVFGTGWGLHDDVYNSCEYVLEPIRGSSVDDYRHLSVRSAASITLDRLLGQW